MFEHFIDDPNLTLALALFAGLVGQTAARHLRVPGIVVLLALGVILGPDVVGVLRPDTLGESLGSLVGFAVAVILFEGGMNLHIPRIKKAGLTIQLLITVGSAVTAILATLVAKACMPGFSWGLSLLFGTLVIVTGPTVVTPLLKRLRVGREVATILEAEGVLIDPIGAITAFVALEVVLHPTAGEVLLGTLGIAGRLGLGGLLGVGAGFVLSLILKRRGLIPEELTNVFTLSAVFTAYQLAEGVLPEAGIAAVTTMGMAVRFFGTPWSASSSSSRSSSRSC